MDGAHFQISKIDRLEVIDHTHGRGSVTRNPESARAIVATGVNVELSLQDDGHTLKIFLSPPKGET